MDTLSALADHRPLLFVLGVTVTWFFLLIVSAGVAARALRKPYGEPSSAIIARLVATAGVLWLVWRLGWLGASGIARLGGWPVWLLALGSLLYFASASLYSFYGKLAFDASVLRLPAARAAMLTNLAAGLGEEMLFRGLALYALARVWGDAAPGRIAAVAVAALLFAVMHMMQVFQGVPLSAARWLILETCVISLWWGALALWGGSIWPAVLLHAVVNALAALQGLKSPMIKPEILAYQRLLWFSLPLGLLGLALLARA